MDGEDEDGVSGMGKTSLSCRQVDCWRAEMLFLSVLDPIKE